MARGFLGDAEKRAFLDAVKDIESRSSAEIVVTIRGQSGSYLHADLIAGLLFGCFALWFQLFSPWDFDLEAILVAPFAVGALGGILTSRAPALRRLLTLPKARRQRVRTAALVAFHEKGVTHTRDRTGVLVYLSLLERAVEVVADRGVVQSVAASAWTEKVAAIQSAMARGERGTVVATRVRALGEILEKALPRRDDDVNELPDEVSG